MGSIDNFLAITQQYFLNDPAAIDNAFNAVLSRKALAATAEATFSQALRNHPELAPQIAQYKTYQQEIANLSHAIGSQPELKDRLNTVLQQKRDLEKNLARSIPAIDLAQQVIDRQALTELLPANAFLIEFVRYDDYDFIKGEFQPARYLAFIIRHDREGVTAIDCGLAKPLDAAIDKFRLAYAKTNFNGESSNFSSAQRNTSSTASTATIEPAPTIVQPDLLALLLPHFPTTGTCYLAPDSKLHILPFHLLETPDGKYFGDRYHLHHLTTARDLYRQKFPTSSNPPTILADPDYNGGTIPTVEVNPKTGSQYSHDVGGAVFEPLPINRILGERVAARYDVPCYSDLDATVDRLERLKAPRLLAIATHGFSLPAQQDFIEAVSSPDANEERVLRDRQHEITQEFRDYWQVRADAGNEWSQQLLIKIDKIGIYKSTDLLTTPISDPMLRSGIALAGANIWRFQGTLDPKFGKGVAFAHIAQWDLWGTELSLMITCVSGLGEVRNSEGVFGLRRALSIAGAKYTISSLWNIPTKASVLLMDRFFELYQSEGLTPPQALAQAQTYVRNITLGELKQLDIGQAIVKELQGETVRKLSLTATDDVKPLADPHFWGAWICQG
jgi:CHAT domain